MLTSPPVQPSERKLSAVDIFCMQTYQPSDRDAARRVRAIVFTLSFVCVVLVALLGFAVSRANAIELERDLLVDELGSQRTAQIKTVLAAKDVERDVANYALETSVRNDLVNEQAVQQEQRSAELAQLAEKVERDKLARADCVTPRSILAASNL